MRALLFLPDLNVGGTQRQFVQLAAGLSARGHAVDVVTFFPGGALTDELSPAVSRWSLFARRGRRPRRPLQFLRSGPRLRVLVERTRAEVLYSALYIPNVVAHRAWKPGLPPLVWGIRGSRQELSWIRRLAFASCRQRAPEIPLAVFNSRAGLAFHEGEGFRFPRTAVIPNGFDVERFAPDAEAGATFRRRFDIPADAFLVGSVGRLVGVKDVPAFLRAAAALHARAPDARFVCVGEGPANAVAQLQEEARRLGIHDRVTFTGEEADMPAVYGALDVLASTSLGEGFPNTIGEAMACGTPCVVTDVGDSAWLVGDTGTVVPPRDPAAQADAWHEHYRRSRGERTDAGERARARIVKELTLEKLVEATERALAGAVRPGPD